MEIYVKKFFYCYIFSIFFWFHTILSNAMILPIWQLQTEQVMTSQIRSHIEYLIQTLYFLLIL